MAERLLQICAGDDDYVDSRDICVRNWNRISIGIDSRVVRSARERGSVAAGETALGRRRPSSPPRLLPRAALPPPRRRGVG